MDAHLLNTIANFIWGIADDFLRDVYVRGKYVDRFSLCADGGSGSCLSGYGFFRSLYTFTS